MKKIAAVLIVMTLFVVSVYAQSDPVPAFYVDIPTAQQEIDDLNAENQAMSSESEEMKSENEQLALSNSDLEGLVREAYIVMDKLNDSAGDLYTLFRTVNDSDQKRQVNDKMIENRKQRYQLEQKKKEFQDQIEVNKTSINNNLRDIAQNTGNIAKNNRRIEILEASIELSSNEGTSLDSAFGNAETVKSEVEALLAQ